jgi:hypothetical protein
MTQDEIIEMVRQAGIPNTNVASLAFGRVETGLELLEAFAKLVAAKEREACAKLVEVPSHWEDWEISCGAQGRELCNDLAQAIRARGQA